METINVDIAQLVGKAYGDFWKFKGRYRVVKGGRGSKKSTTTALWIIFQMMNYFHSYNLKPSTLVLRRFADTNRDSTWAQLQWAIDRMNVSHLWNATKSPLELIYKPSGQKIIFRGLDKPQSINSLVAQDGQICWVWWEEAFQVTNEDTFNKIDLSIRGSVQPPLFKQHTITLNPWSDKHWIKSRFFDHPNSETLAITRNYDSNEFLGADDIRIFEQMRIENPKRYAIEGRGDWGISEGAVFDRWRVARFNPEIMAKEINRSTMKPRYKSFYGLDFGFSQDPTAFVWLLVSEEKREIYVCAEIYKRELLLDQLAKILIQRGLQRAEIIADSAAPQLIAELRARGIFNIKAAKKGAGSIEGGIARLRDYEIIINEACPNAIIEFSNYCWKQDSSGQLMARPIDEYNHLIDAMRYATESINAITYRW